jgi:hypothetical protein
MQFPTVFVALTTATAVQAAILGRTVPLSKLSNSLEKRLTCELGGNALCQVHCSALAHCKSHCAK